MHILLRWICKVSLEKKLLTNMTINKCKICGVPLEGFGYRLIARPLFGVFPSKKNKKICNKCEGKK